MPLSKIDQFVEYMRNNAPDPANQETAKKLNRALHAVGAVEETKKNATRHLNYEDGVVTGIGIGIGFAALSAQSTQPATPASRLDQLCAEARELADKPGGPTQQEALAKSLEMAQEMRSLGLDTAADVFEESVLSMDMLMSFGLSGKQAADIVLGPA